jgi:hypothetical protein
LCGEKYLMICDKGAAIRRVFFDHEVQSLNKVLNNYLLLWIITFMSEKNKTCRPSRKE